MAESPESSLLDMDESKVDTLDEDVCEFCNCESSDEREELPRLEEMLLVSLMESLLAIKGLTAAYIGAFI